MVFSSLKRLLQRQSQIQELGLEIRPDGIAWALRAPAGEEADRAGFEPCTPAGRQETLTRLVEQKHLDNAQVSAVLPIEQYQVFQVERPSVDDSELVDAVRWKLKDMLDYRIEDAVFDVFPFPVDGAKGVTELINVVSARKTLITDIAKLTERAGLILNRVDIADLALRNLAAPLDPEGRGVALVFLRQNMGQMVLCKGPVLYLSRRLDISESGLIDFALQEPTVQGLALELQRSLDYYESQMGQVPPRSVYVLTRPDGPNVLNLLSGNIAGAVLPYELGGEYDFRSVLALAGLQTVAEVVA